MGSFVLSTIKRWKGSLIRIRPYSPADTIVKPATIEEDAVDADDASSNKASSVTVVAYESSDDDSSSLSSIHTGSLTSFAGNLSPPEIEFHEDLWSGDDNKKKDEDTAAAVAAAVRRQERLSPATSVEEQLSKKKDDGGGGRQQGRPSPAASSKKSTKADIRPKEDVKVKPVSPAVAGPPSKSKTDIVTPAKKTIRPDMIGPSITSIPSIISSFSSLMDDFNPTVENGQEINDEENTVMTLEILDGIHPCDSAMLLSGCPSERIDTFKREENDAEEDDEGNQYVFESEPRETGPDVTENSMASNSNGANKTNKRSDKVGTEITTQKRYQTGSIVKHLNALYKTSKEGVIAEQQLSNKPSFDRSIEKEEVDLIVGVLEIEICRM